MTKWPLIHRALHWLMAVAIIAMLAMGIVMVELDDGPAKLKVYALHKSIGITLLALLALRVLARLVIARPPSEQKGWPAHAAKLGHLCLYGLMLAMPLSGWLLNSAANFPLNWFGWLSVPSIYQPDEIAKLLFRDIHEYLAWALTLLILGHLAAALGHHLRSKDGVLVAMLPSPTGALLLCLLLVSSVYAGYRYIGGEKDLSRSSVPGLGSNSSNSGNSIVVTETSSTLANPTGPSLWRVDGNNSQLSFTGTYDGIEFSGQFPFSAEVRFEPERLAGSVIEAVIDVTGVDSQSRDRDEALAEAEWFDFRRFPKATFVASNIRAMPGGGFQADAQLTIRDITRAFSYEFIWHGDSEQASLNSKTVLQRLDYDIGTGIWVDAIVGHEVTVGVELKLIKNQ